MQLLVGQAEEIVGNPARHISRRGDAADSAITALVVATTNREAICILRGSAADERKKKQMKGVRLPGGETRGPPPFPRGWTRALLSRTPFLIRSLLLAPGLAAPLCRVARGPAGKPGVFFSFPPRFPLAFSPNKPGGLHLHQAAAAKGVGPTPQLQRRLGLARIELPEPKLKGLAHRLLQVKRGFLSAQLTASDGHLVGLSFKMKHGHKPGYHLKVGQEHSKKGWDGPGYSKKGWDAFDSSSLPYSSYSAGPYSSYGSQSYQSMFRGAHGLSLGHASSLYSDGLQSYSYKDAASFGYPFSGYQVPGYVTTVPKLPVTKLVDSVPSMLPAVSGVYDQATIVQSFPVAKTIGGHAKVPAARIVHKVPLSALPKKITYAQQQVPGTAHGFHPVVVHTVKPVSSIGALRTPIYGATGAGELYPIDIDGSAYQEDDAGGAEDAQSGAGYGNGDSAGAQNGEAQGGPV
ncbi:hypothetical protein MTO96_009691 [Rhipicephalus appendiculatus]